MAIEAHFYAKATVAAFELLICSIVTTKAKTIRASWKAAKVGAHLCSEIDQWITLEEIGRNLVACPGNDF
ncbi:hypothetical protein Nepgr_005856 [Nepenthes gracilis]|uniref:Uncharacterized protein n=1 Tax=Nepenthes gracilis TaxID=150966 RepID=A0AAD3XGU5_NEPGR|nr:hypothetical protein Nepgr_005856 [Nepenthes gracilis]